MFTDGAATVATGNSPVFTSASYNFVAGDVGAWVYIASGTNWVPGWYQIASVATNAATLSAAIGQAVQTVVQSVNTRYPDHMAATAGCATTASPTGATWTIDYSQQAAAQISYTDLASVGAGLLVSSVAHPFAAQQVGNTLIIASGTNFTAGRYVIASVAAGVATVQGAANITTGAGVSGVGGLGGCAKTPGSVGANFGSGNVAFVVSGTTYSISSSSNNVANGVVNNTATGFWIGWATNRCLNNTDAAPTLQYTVSSVTMFNDRSNHYNLIIDGNSQTTSSACTGGVYDSCTFKNMTAASTPDAFSRVLITGCSAAQLGSGQNASYSEAYGNTATPFLGPCTKCLSYLNTGATTDGFSVPTSDALLSECTAWNNGRHGFLFASNGRGQGLIRCHSEGHAAGYGYEPNGNVVSLTLCSDYNNASGRVHIVAGTPTQQVGAITLTGTAFNNSAGNDLSLNNTAGGGAMIRGQAGAFPRGTTTGYSDFGAVQHQDSGGGGTFGGWESFGYPIPSRPAMIPGGG